jgi:hypothetical protein
MYDLGDVVSITFTTKDSSGNLAAPGALPTATVTLPDGTSTAGTVTLVSLGTYTVTFASSQIGLHGIKATWSGGTAVPGSYVDAAAVDDPAYLPLIGLAEAKDYLNLDKTVSTYDEKVRQLILVATGHAERHTNRALARQTVVQVASGGNTYILLWKPQVLSVTSVVENGVTLQTTDYVVNKLSGILLRGTYAYTVPWIIGVDNVTVTYVVGMANPPEDLRNSVKEILRWLWSNTQQAGRPSRGQQAEGLLADALPKWLLRPLDDYCMPGLG